MRALFLLTLLLTACARPEGPPAEGTAATAPERSARADAFARLPTAPDEEVATAAADRARAGEGLAAELAERCWRTERLSAATREACLLAWAAGTEPSPALDEICAAEAPRSRAAAIAAVRRGSPLYRLGAEALLAALERLAADPAWLRARAVARWLRHRPGQPPWILRALRERLAVEGEPSPADLGSLLAAEATAGLGAHARRVAEHCDPAAGGIVRTRCWRLLSTLVDEEAGAEALTPYLPSPRDPAWILFQRAFPERALAIQRHFQL